MRPMTLAEKGGLKALSKGCYRVVGVDTFEGPLADYLIADVPDLELAKQMADRRGGPMNPVYIYDFEGKLVYQAGTP